MPPGTGGLGNSKNMLFESFFDVLKVFIKSLNNDFIIKFLFFITGTKIKRTS